MEQFSAKDLFGGLTPSVPGVAMAIPKPKSSSTIEHPEKLTVKTVHAIMASLIFSVEFKWKLHNLINYNFRETAMNTDWTFIRQTTGEVLAAACYDKRDDYTHIFCPPDLVEVRPLLHLVVPKCAEDSSDVCVTRNQLIVESIQFPDVTVQQPDTKSFSITFGSLEARLRPPLLSFLWKSGHEAVVDGHYDAYTLNPESEKWKAAIAKASASPLPDGFYVDILRESDAEFIDSFWAYKNTKSIETIKECISNRPSIAIRLSNPTKDTGDLIAWAVTRVDWSIGILNVVEAYRGKGFGKTVTALLSQKHLEQLPSPEVLPFHEEERLQAMKDRQLRPFIYVDPTNTTSVKLHESIGYVKDVPHRWIKAP